MHTPKDIIDILRFDEGGWKKNLILIGLSQLIMMIGMSSCVPFLPLFVRQLGVVDPSEAKFWSGIVFSGPYILSIILVPVWGAMGDKYGRKLMVVRAIIGLAIAMFLMGFARNVWDLFLLRVLQGAVSGFIAASLGFISAETPRDRTGFAIGLLTGAQSAGNIIGPLFGGVLSDITGIRPVFFIVAVLCLIIGLLIIIFVVEKNFIPNSKSINSPKAMLSTVLRNKELKQLLILIIIAQAGIQFTVPLFPFFVEKLNAPVEYLSTITGMLVGITGIFSIIFAPVWGRRNDRKDFRKTISIASLIVGIATIAQIFVSHYLLLFPFRIIIGIFIAAIVPTLYSSMSKNSDQENVSGVMGIASSANLFGALISFLAMAVISSTLGMEICFVLSGFLLFYVFLSGKKKKLTRH